MQIIDLSGLAKQSACFALVVRINVSVSLSHILLLLLFLLLLLLFDTYLGTPRAVVAR